MAELDSLPIILLAALLLGLRHAVDPDHVAAMATLVAGAPKRGARAAGTLGLTWGLGHGAMLVAVGVPLVLVGGGAPHWLQQTADAAVALMIIGLSLKLIRQSRRERLHLHAHEHMGGVRHAHVHAHRQGASHEHRHPVRTRRAAFGIGLLHGLGGSGAVTLVLLAAIDSKGLAVAALALFAAGSTATMAVASTGFGVTLALAHGRRAFAHVQSALGCVTLVFGLVYAMGAARLLG